LSEDYARQISCCSLRIQNVFRTQESGKLKYSLLLSTLWLLITSTPALFAQTSPGFAVIDGTQNPPQIVSSNINIAITDNGTGRYLLIFDDPVVYFNGTALPAGPGFDVSPAMLTAVQDSSDPKKIVVNTRVVDSSAASGHGLTDGRFSIEVHF